MGNVERQPQVTGEFDGKSDGNPARKLGNTKRCFESGDSKHELRLQLRLSS